MGYTTSQKYLRAPKNQEKLIEKQNYKAASALSMTEIVKRYVHVFKSTTEQYHPRRREEKKQRQLQPA